MTLVAAAGLLVGVTVPAHAEAILMKSKTFSAPNGAWGNATWYADRSDGKVTNWVTATADDSPGGRCTETWWDYATKPHRHFNPGVVVNCTGSKQTLSKLHVTNYYGIAGFQVIVCSVPNTNGPITRNSSNCRGDLGGMYLHSGKRYEQFGVNAIQYPNGVRIDRA
jgi:hypothetical protein